MLRGRRRCASVAEVRADVERAGGDASAQCGFGRCFCVKTAQGISGRKERGHWPRVSKIGQQQGPGPAAWFWQSAALKYLATALQVADMFTKQIFPKHFERLRRVMMGHENFDDMCER